MHVDFVRRSRHIVLSFPPVRRKTVDSVPVGTRCPAEEDKCKEVLYCYQDDCPVPLKGTGENVPGAAIRKPYRHDLRTVSPWEALCISGLSG